MDAAMGAAVDAAVAGCRADAAGGATPSPRFEVASQGFGALLYVIISLTPVVSVI